MPATLERPSPVTQLDSIKGRQAKALIGVDPRQNREILSLIGRALRETDLSQKEAALNAGVKEQQFSAALNGQGNFGAMWLWAQPDRFLLRLIDLVMEARGLSREAAQQVRADRIAELVRLLLEVA